MTITEMEKKIRQTRNIVCRYLSALLIADYHLRIDDGEQIHAETGSTNVLLEQMFAVDDCVVLARKGETVSMLRFVFGNEPYEVLSDYSVSLEEVLKPTNTYADSLAAQQRPKDRP